MAVNSSDPVQLAAAGARVEVLVVRDPDAAAVVRVFVDGVEVSATEAHVDPGAGHMLSDWRAARDAILVGGSSEAFTAAAVEAFDMAEGSEYIVDDLDEDVDVDGD